MSINNGSLLFEKLHWFPFNESLHEVPAEWRIVGVIYFLFSLICIIPYLTCLWCIIMDKELREKPTYIIVFHIGIADVLQLIFNGLFGGVFTFFGTTWGFRLNKVIGGIMNIGWVVYTAMAHVLAFNRFVCICKPHLRQKFFSTKKSEILMWICWIYGFAWLGAYMCPNVNLVFNVYYRNWDYDITPLSRLFWFVELLQDTFHFFMSVIWYAFSFVAIRKTANQISHHQINENRKEMKLLIQAMLICAMIGLTLIGFFVVPEIDSGNWVTTASTLIWLACCGNNCAIYLTFNKTLRRRVAKILLRKRDRKIGHLKKKQEERTEGQPTTGVTPPTVTAPHYRYITRYKLNIVIDHNEINSMHPSAIRR